MSTKYNVVWHQREKAIAFAHNEGGLTMWKKSSERAAKFTLQRATRFVARFVNNQTLLEVLET